MDVNINDASVLALIIGAVVWLIAMIISLLIAYLIIKAAVRNGTLEAMRQARGEGLLR